VRKAYDRIDEWKLIQQNFTCHQVFVDGRYFYILAFFLTLARICLILSKFSKIELGVTMRLILEWDLNYWK
jgi:hypothetical protein